MVATFKPEVKGAPAKISMFNYVGEEVSAPVAVKTTFKANEVKFEWSPLANAVLVKTETDLDTTGQSYYGESGLYLLASDGKFDCKVPAAKDNGPFYDFAWSPRGKSFAAISGRSPHGALLHNLKGDPIFDFGQAHRNTIRFSPHGRFLCLGGFGNLSGDMDFWDMNKKTKIGSTRAKDAVSQQWSPCGRFFMTATLVPRMREGNGVAFYSYRGELVHSKPVKDASKVLFRPVEKDVYPDRPQTPIKEGLRAPCVVPGSGSAAAVSSANGSKPKGVYRPPGSSGSLAAMMRKERESATTAKPVSVDAPIPGETAAANQGKSKAALRRERKKRAEAARKAQEF